MQNIHSEKTKNILPADWVTIRTFSRELNYRAFLEMSLYILATILIQRTTHFLTCADAWWNANTHEVLERDEDGDENNESLPHSGNTTTISVIEVTEPHGVE